jgi:hypothetical protein
MARFSAFIIATAVLVGGCIGASSAASAPGSPSGAADAVRTPTIDLEITGGLAAGTYTSSGDSSLDVCTHAADGSWRVMYAGGTPWTNVDLLIGPRAAEPGRSSDVALEITAKKGYLWIDQGGFRGGDAPGRSDVKVDIRPTADTMTFIVDASTPNRTPGGDGERSAVALTVTCPI